MSGITISRSSALSLALLSVSFAQDPATVGRFNPLIKAELVPIHVMLLPNGKLLYVDRHDQGTHDITPRVWDPITDITIRTPTPAYDLFCSGHSMLRDGNVLFSGGHVVDYQGVVNLSIYEWKTNTWNTRLPGMAKARWYPTNTTLPNGDVLITSGTYEKDKYVDVPEVYEWRTNTLRSLDNGAKKREYYPFMYVLPGGRVFSAGGDSLMGILDVTGRGKWEDVGMTTFARYRTYGASVQYDRGRILVSGGNEAPPTATAETIDMNATKPAWKDIEPMHFARRHHTAVMLPDGKVLVTGGTGGYGFNNGAGAVFDAEMWDPETGHWTLMAKASTRRMYHSISLLLPDGRVLTGGGGHPGTDADFLDEHPDWEIYEPPYLFKGTRPVIDAAPDTILYGKPFAIESKHAGNLKASLLRLACVTHAWDHNADFNRLEVKRLSATSLQIDAPADSVATVPGPHMLFLVDEAGIPSKAKVLWVVSSPRQASLFPASPKIRLRLVVSGNRLRAPESALGNEAVCRLLDTQGRSLGWLTRAEGGDFLLPAGMRTGSYLAEVSQGSLKEGNRKEGNRKVTQRIFIP